MIHINEQQEFHLVTENTSTILKVLPSGHLSNLYYGKRIREKNSYDSLYMNYGVPLGCDTAYSKETKHYNLGSTKLEAAAFGKGDYREPSVLLTTEAGTRTSDFLYESHEVYEGKNAFDGLPATFMNGDHVTTLEITLYDQSLDVRLVLSYSVFDARNVIARSAVLVNGQQGTIMVDRLMSMNLDLPGRDMDIMTLDGHWIRERHVHRRPLSHGTFSIDSKKGVSGSDHNPFVALMSGDANEDQGDIYGFGLVYSGNHKALVTLSDLNMTRVQLGVSDFDFNWTLDKGESFQTPEVLMTFTDKGLNGMSQNYHNIIQHNLIPKQWQFKERPVLFNNWEATYFDFDEGKLVKLAKAAKDLGVELFVLDDGWFGQRNDDTSSLGDWFENRKKLPHGLEGLSHKFKGLGLDFGIWVEPEMISEDSKLYRKHPEWAITSPERTPSYGRNQLILDMANDEVINYLYNILSDVFKRGQVAYVKWDMNRNFSDLHSKVLPPERQKEHSHRYVLGLYKLLDRLTKTFPNILFESCASGGNRFDLGMLYYMPQTWTSDNTDAGERIDIQYGTSMVYPPSTMGNHVSGAPSHQVLRRTPLETRFNVAAFGLLGYEMDLTALTPFEKKVIKEQIRTYKRHRQLLQFGTFHRLSSPFEGNITQWMVVDEDQKEGLIGYYQKLQKPHPGLEQMNLRGLNPVLLYEVTSRQMSLNIRRFGNMVNRVSPVKIRDNSLIQTLISNRYQYKSEKEEVRAYGDELMYAGMQLLPQFTGTGYNDQVRLIGDFGSRVYHMKAIKEKLYLENR